MTFEKACIAGEAADEFYLSGKYKPAIKAYLKIVGDMVSRKEIDPFLMSKATLGLLLSYIKNGETDNAFEIWTADPEENFLGVGTSGIENGQVSLNDLIIYYFIGAFFNSLSNAEGDVAASFVSHSMGMIYEYAAENKEILPLMVNNWKLHLMYIFDNAIPDKYADEVSELENEIGETIPLHELTFPKPSKWKIDWVTKTD